MSKRKIININGDKCNGCGLCLPNCPEGALQIIDGKAMLISDLFCDGLGACIGHCPRGAISIEQREAGDYDERKVMANIIKQGNNVIKAHLLHLKQHKQNEYFTQAINFLKEKWLPNPLQKDTRHNYGCPGSRVVDFGNKPKVTPERSIPKEVSQLRQWPVQTHLVPASAGYLQDSNLLIAADCVPFAYANFHRDLLAGKILLIGCPKLDDVQAYQEKLIEIVKNNNIKSITYAHMEVPCCFGLNDIIESAITSSGRKIPYKEIIISIKGEIING